MPKLPSYIKDTAHFLRKLDDLKELPPGYLLVTLDVSSLYTNILVPHKEGIEACRKALNSSGHLSRSRLKTESICDLITVSTKWCRYIDDIFMVWTHGEDKLEDFINHVNSLHSTIKFTHEFSKSHISFLDVTVSLDNNNKISTDLFVKSTDTHQYLLHTSCHPSHIKRSIPFSLALRIRRICSTTEKFQQRTNELLEF